MIRKVSTDKRGWDTLLPYVLFAYREVPNESTGFSPFELLFGCYIRGSLDILRNAWTEDTVNDTTALAWVLKMREKLEKMQAVAQERQETTQSTMKKRYDRNTRTRSFQKGDQVLVLMPVPSGKLAAQWTGTYLITKKLSPVTYSMDMHDRKKRARTVHINMLKAWKSPEASVFAATIDYSQTEKDYGPEQHLYAERTESDGDFEIGKALTGEQRQQWSDIVLDFPEVFSVVPGCTQAAEHVINTRDVPPVGSVARRLPKAWETKVLNEVQEMLEAGVIEPCTGPWSSQIVPVRKSDGSVCVCIDYRDVNAITVEDPYPIPRIEELLERLGDAWFISTFNLAKGYYQVPVNPNDKDCLHVKAR